MGFFSKLFGGDGGPPVPEWARFFTPREYEEFLACVAAYFRRRGIEVEIDDGVVTRVGTDAAGERLGLHNLAQVCHQGEPREWPEIVEGHFDSLERTREEAEEMDEVMGDFEEIAGLLTLRLFPVDYLDQAGIDLVYLETLPGTLSCLVFDLPAAVRTVARKDADSWGRSDEELFERALANLRDAEDAPEASTEELEGGVELRLLNGESFMTASHALRLEWHEGFVGPHGSLVSVPHRHVLLCHPVRDLRAVQALHLLIQVTHGMYIEGPGSISPRVYWYRDGTFTDIPYELSEEAASITPPESLVQVLNQLDDSSPQRQ